MCSALTQIWHKTFTTDDNLWNDSRWTEQTRIVATITQAVSLFGSCYIYTAVPPAKWKVTRSWSCLIWKNWRRRGRWWRAAVWGWGGLPAYLFEETKPAKCSLTWNRQSRAGTGLVYRYHCILGLSSLLRATNIPILTSSFCHVYHVYIENHSKIDDTKKNHLLANLDLLPMVERRFHLSSSV